MNKLLFKNGQLFNQELDHSITLECFNSEIKEIENIKIKVLANTTLEIISSDSVKTKYNILFDVLDNVEATIIEQKTSDAIKHQYTINLGENSHLNLYKFYNVKDAKEAVNINLNKDYASINYYFKTITKHKEKYDINVYHNAKNTNSYINNAGVNILNGELTFNISSYVESEITNCNIDQTSRIINLTDNNCIINPNLFIEENDVVANHSAAIGKFSDEELFYLMSRGLSHEQSLNLLLKGFLLNNFDFDEDRVLFVTNIINSYWGE